MTSSVERHTTHSEAETHALAARLAHTLRPGMVVALDGPLGAGKTAFVRGLAEGLGAVGNAVSSPTFVIVQEYATTAAPLVHVDAYRMSSPDELETIGWDEMIARRDVVIAVEWAARLADALPPDAVHVQIKYVHGAPNHRSIEIRSPLQTSGIRS